MDIKLVVFDFDGVFTNGSIQFYDSKIIKSYNIKDGIGIKRLLEYNIQVGVISGYHINQSQEDIINHLNIPYKEYSSKNKLNVLLEWCNKLNIELYNVAYMGDDINDLEVLNNVKLSGCPKDAISEVKECVHFISSINGGQGCIRDFCDYILNNILSNNFDNIIQEIKSEFYYQINNFNMTDIIKLSNIIKNAPRNIYFLGVGKSGNIAKHCCDLLKCISYSSFYLDLLNLTHGDIGTITSNDIIIIFSNSGNTEEIIKITHLLKKIGSRIICICCKEKTQISELCDVLIITPFKIEISGTIDKIPTNSCMSHLIFSNILVSVLKENISLEKYTYNHLSGNIGYNLIKIKDIININYPKVIIKNDENSILLKFILIKMIEYNLGCCFFFCENDDIIGMLTDGDIRRYMSEYNLSDIIYIEKINKKFYYESDLNKFIKDCNKIGTGIIPIILNNKMKGYIEI